mmetsp:Transcript_9111/g.8982  ORF Transcript_9111/g.8982 Transcript_9111/m.8982 type:complete len:404 (-) Transcript_9111:322-1533(-)|eukprot:CAMPEP_0119038836 /NCGR_PEP_ID=MMETSP1177-20130426/7998_1 /TAXON_ID=2985 /ORGANISM="Ochromonas sp, Strain CCMP1899" /LENGTH=403 /DNA_ID=CAMNT_0007001933 /DNA_START=86 /DNA_END=1297 /DNA_ORIENTATION=-
MEKADEKRAFDDMMAEISDSDSDEEETRTKASYTIAAPKNSRDTEQSNTWSSSCNAKRTAQDEEIENFGCGSDQPLQHQSEQINATKRWLMKPCPPGDPPVLCYVERHRTGFGRLNPTYKCYLEGNGQDGQGQQPRFLMGAKKKNGSKTSYYLISMDADQQDDRGGESILGKVRGNSVGSQYLITDPGLAPDKAVAPSMFRKELGLVRFEFDSGGPSRIEAYIPSVNTAGSASVWQPNNEDLGMNANIEKQRYNNLLPLMNKKPKWDDAHGGHVLNFQGRVTESSVKNFQLCSASIRNGVVPNDDVVLQFGRVAKHKFTLDVRYPMSPMQAFSIAIACMDGKIADRKGYEYMRKLTGNSSADDHDGNQQAKGSVDGRKSFTGALSQAMPSSQYLKDKISRSFK